MEVIPAGRAALILATNPVFILLTAAVFLGEKITPLKLLGCLAAVGGAIVVISKGNLLSPFSDGFGRGETYALGSLFSWMFYTLLIKNVVRRVPGLIAIAACACLGTLMLAVPVTMEGSIYQVSDFSIMSWFSVFYLGALGTALGTLWYYHGIEALGASTAGICINFVPLGAVCFGALFLGEEITTPIVLGGALIMTGAGLASISKAKEIEAEQSDKTRQGRRSLEVGGSKQLKRMV